MTSNIGIRLSITIGCIFKFVSSSKINSASAASAPQSSIMSSTCNSDRLKASLFGLFVADATAMPVHWHYDLNQLKRDYGTVTGYVRPKDRFDGSILNLSNTGGGGRGSDHGDIVGSVILHGKKKYWVRGGSYHYHLGLQAGKCLFIFILKTPLEVIPS